jgi:hypothetical protein
MARRRQKRRRRVFRLVGWNRQEAEINEWEEEWNRQEAERRRRVFRL